MDAGILWFKASDGKPIAYRKVLPEGEDRPKALVLAIHGMNDHSGRFLHLARALAERGCAVWLPDVRGHGETDPGPDRGHLEKGSGLDRTVQDIGELAGLAAGEYKGIPLFLFGHSFGSIVALMFAARRGDSLAGLALSGLPCRQPAALDAAGRAIVAVAIAAAGQKAPGRLPKKMTFGAYAKTVPDARTGSDWITRDPAVVDAYIADPKCNFTCTYGFYHELMTGVSHIHSPGFPSALPERLPILSLAGSMDPVAGFKAGFKASTEHLRRSGKGAVESILYEGSRHEIINDLDRAKVMDDLGNWIFRHIA